MKTEEEKQRKNRGNEIEKQNTKKQTEIKNRAKTGNKKNGY